MVINIDVLPGTSPSDIDLNFIGENANDILKSSPVTYLNSNELKGSLFGSGYNGSVSLLDTNFFLAHDVPHAILAEYLREGSWALGNLLEGHEFLVLARNHNSSI